MLFWGLGQAVELVHQPSQSREAAVSGYADKYLRVAYVPQPDLATAEISSMRDSVVTRLH